MIKKLTLITLIILVLTSSVSALEINTTVGEYGITYNFIPNLPINQSIYFDNIEIEYPVSDKLFLPTGMYTTGTVHTLTITDIDTNTVYKEETTIEEKPFYTGFGMLGLLLIIIALLYISTKVPYLGYATIAMATLGFIYCMKNSTDFIEPLIFMAFLISSIFTIKGE